MAKAGRKSAGVGPSNQPAGPRLRAEGGAPHAYVDTLEDSDVAFLKHYMDHNERERVRLEVVCVGVDPGLVVDPAVRNTVGLHGQ